MNDIKRLQDDSVPMCLQDVRDVTAQMSPTYVLDGEHNISLMKYIDLVFIACHIVCQGIQKNDVHSLEWLIKERSDYLPAPIKSLALCYLKHHQAIKLSGGLSQDQLDFFVSPDTKNLQPASSIPNGMPAPQKEKRA